MKQRSRVVRALQWAAHALRRSVGGLRGQTGRWRRRPPPSDAELLERVRHTVADVSRPDEIQVEIRARHVTLSGVILARETVALLRHVAKVPGVAKVNNQLRVQRIAWRSRRTRRREPENR